MKSNAIKMSVGNVTVKIYTRIKTGANGKKLTFYQLADRTSGKRVLRGFSDIAEAKAEAKRIAEQIATGQTEAASLTNAQAASHVRAVELLRPFDVSLEVAVATYVESRKILGRDAVIEASRFYKRHGADTITPRTVEQAAKELADARAARGKSERYVTDLRVRLARFSNDFKCDISSVTGPEVQAWLDRLNVAPQTAKNFRTVLHTLFSFAESRGYTMKGSNPVADTESISTNGDGAIDIYSPDEIEKLLQAAPEHFIPVLALGAFAGVRIGEIERLDWRDIDLTGGFIHVGADKAKTRSRRLVPVAPNLAQWLAKGNRQTGPVWPGTPDGLRYARKMTVAKSGIQWKENALRHSFISYRLADIQNAAQVALEAGNSPQMVFKHYREIVKPETAKAWFAIVPSALTSVIASPGGASKAPSSAHEI